MEEVGRTIIQKAKYAQQIIGRLPNVIAPMFASPGFKEFVVDFNGSGKTVAQINRALLEKGIFGGKDLSAAFPALGQSALYCVTEIHTQSDIDCLAQTLAEILNS